MTTSRFTCSAVMLGLVFAVAVASAGVSDVQRAERARIRTERAAADATYAAQERECRSRFVVTSCIDEARQARREKVARLRREESVLEDDIRKERSAERLREIDGNQQREQARQREAASAPAADGARAGSPKAPVPQATVRPAKAAASPEAARAAVANRSAEAARSRAVFEARRDAADTHRHEVEARNAERASHGKAAAPLPTPSAPSAP